jgi:putative resolvase
VLYARVSSADQKADLDRPVARLAAFAADQGIRVARVVAEVGGGLNGHRKGLMTVLRSPEYGIIVVEHRDRLARCGSEYVEAALAASGRRLIVVEPDEVKDD